jgi:hypothetical protein
MRIQIQVPRYPAWVLWLVGVPATIAAVCLIVFFFTLFLIVLGVATALLALRLWWLRHKLRRTPASGVIEGEYAVVSETKPLRERSRLSE